MRIGIDAHAAEADGSGNCTYIRNLVSALTAGDEENRYFLYVTDLAHPFYRGFEGRPNIFLRRLGVKSPLVRIPLHLSRATVRDEVDVLHVQFVAPPFHRGALVVTIHDLGFLRVPKTFSRIFVWRSKVLVERAARRAAKIITGSISSKEDIIKTYGLAEDRLEVVPCGVEAAFFEPAGPRRVEEAAAKYGLRRPYILSVSRLNPRKNLAALARAFSRFKGFGGRPHSLVIAGKRDFEAGKTLAAVKAAGGPDVVLPGFVDDEDLPALYQGAEIFVYPSLFEGVGLPVLEAMASGLPVVTSATSSLPEIAGEAALTVDPLDEEALAAALARLAGDPALRKDLGAKGRARAANFSWEAAARRTLEVYRAAAPDESPVRLR
ncbi:MAG: glycosyltransferase family 4 protein [Candidatus Aminicenantes bacterium]|nr:glycosyltransferase family 4 protein [Candidatus Aminicenantes bacterium]